MSLQEPHGFLYTTLIDPPLPTPLAWIPLVCRAVAITISVPFICLGALDIVSYLIARTLHLHSRRVPRTPPGSNFKQTPLGSTDDMAMCALTDGEESPIDVKINLPRRRQEDVTQSDRDEAGGLGLVFEAKSTNPKSKELLTLKVPSFKSRSKSGKHGSHSPRSVANNLRPDDNGDQTTSASSSPRLDSPPDPQVWNVVPPTPPKKKANGISTSPESSSTSSPPSGRSDRAFNACVSPSSSTTTIDELDAAARYASFSSRGTPMGSNTSSGVSSPVIGLDLEDHLTNSPPGTHNSIDAATDAATIAIDSNKVQGVNDGTTPIKRKPEPLVVGGVELGPPLEGENKTPVEGDYAAALEAQRQEATPTQQSDLDDEQDTPVKEEPTPGRSDETQQQGAAQPADDEVDAESLGRRLAEEYDREHEADQEGNEQATTTDLRVTTDYTISELHDLIIRAQELKQQGNTAFQETGDDTSMSRAESSYKEALSCLPRTKIKEEAEVAAEARDRRDPVNSSDITSSGVQEVSEDQAAEIQAHEESKRLAEEARRLEEERAANDPLLKERREIESEVDDLKKTLWGNLGAVWVKKGDDKEAVEACNEAIKLDPYYVKAIHRRATANERIASWSSLSAALEDYKTLITILPTNSSLLRQSQQALRTLPPRIQAQQDKEKDEMLGKLKDLGDSILGKFGLSTNNFKFDQQEGGGYSMRFER